MTANVLLDVTRRYRALTLMLAAFSLIPAFGQERFGELTGLVTDPSGGRIPAATVVLTNRDTGRTITLTGGGGGTYDAGNLEPGHYKGRVAAKGFSASEIPDVELKVGQTLKVDARLTIGATSETVQVTETVPLIDVEGNMVAHNITSEEIDRLPKARTFQSLVTLSPSVN